MTQTPQQYDERPPSVTAMNFVGTAESATQIGNWLSNYGAFVMYDSARSRALIQTADNNFVTLNDTDWVLLDSTLKITCMKNADFELKYEPTYVDEECPPEAPAVEPEVEDPVVEEPSGEEEPVADPEVPA